MSIKTSRITWLYRRTERHKLKSMFKCGVAGERSVYVCSSNKVLAKTIMSLLDA